MVSCLSPLNAWGLNEPSTTVRLADGLRGLNLGTTDPQGPKGQGACSAEVATTVGRTAALAALRPHPTVLDGEALRGVPRTVDARHHVGEISTTSKSRPSCTETYAAEGGLADCLRWFRLLVLPCRLFPEALGEA